MALRAVGSPEARQVPDVQSRRWSNPVGSEILSPGSGAGRMIVGLFRRAVSGGGWMRSLRQHLCRPRCSGESWSMRPLLQKMLPPFHGRAQPGWRLGLPVPVRGKFPHAIAGRLPGPASNFEVEDRVSSIPRTPEEPPFSDPSADGR